MRYLLTLWVWVPTTALMWLLCKLTGAVPLSRRGRQRIYAGGSRPWRWWRERFGMDAITIGAITVIAGTSSRRLIAHERRHVTQATWLGPLYLPAYLVGCVVGLCRGGWYRMHPMEIDARRHEAMP